MKTISIILGKIALFFCKLIGRGSSFPGDFTYKINKNILKDLEKAKTVICVTGSSGKGSTSSIIAEVCKKEGYKVCYNDKGSNELPAVITSMIENCTITGKTKSDIMIFETDERYTKYIYPDLKPNYVILTNLTRDQPPRQGHFDFVLSEIKKALNNNIKLITNGDDPFLRKINLDNKMKTCYYSIEKEKYSYQENKFRSLNINRCPICHSKLKYNYYNFEYLGDYKCEKCDFKKPDCKYNITDIDYKNNTITINNKNKMKVDSNILFNIYNILAAYSCLVEIGIKEDKIAKGISDISINKKLYNIFKYNNRIVTVLNNKNENATTFNESINYTLRSKNKKTIVIGWWQISRRYDFDDLSWLYDIDFELLKNQNVEKFICAGPQRYDIAVRLKYAGIDEKKIEIFEDLYKAENKIKSSKGDIYAILNFDYIKPFEKIMEDK